MSKPYRFLGTWRAGRSNWRLQALSIFSLAVAFVCLASALLVVTNLSSVRDRWSRAGRATVYLRDVIERTRKLWAKQYETVGDRLHLFSAVAEFVDASTVLYPGSYVDLTPSFVWPSVTYVDVDRRANQFFADSSGVDELLAEHDVDPARHAVRFIHADYQDSLELSPESFDLLISLYAGFVSEHNTDYLRVGGFLMVNSSHGDAAMASIDPRYELAAVVINSNGKYTTRTTDLDSYLLPKSDIEVTKELLHETGRGIGYTKSPFAYVFRRSA